MKKEEKHENDLAEKVLGLADFVGRLRVFMIQISSTPKEDVTEECVAEMDSYISNGGVHKTGMTDNIRMYRSIIKGTV